MTKAERQEKNAAWREWYAKHQEEMQVYYRKRYKRIVKNETAAEREQRLSRQRVAQQRYSEAHAVEINEKRKEERKQRCSKCLRTRQKGQRLLIKTAVTGRVIGRYCDKCRTKKGL
jgi:hypothetical protein